MHISQALIVVGYKKTPRTSAFLCCELHVLILAGFQTHTLHLQFVVLKTEPFQYVEEAPEHSDSLSG